jgi:hypothetical protein
MTYKEFIDALKDAGGEFISSGSVGSCHTVCKWTVPGNGQEVMILIDVDINGKYVAYRQMPTADIQDHLDWLKETKKPVSQKRTKGKAL